MIYDATNDAILRVGADDFEDFGDSSDRQHRYHCNLVLTIRHMKLGAWDIICVSRLIQGSADIRAVLCSC
jgi:hypothetical protein